MQYRALEKRQYLNIMTEYNLFANKFSTNTSPDTLRHHPDTIQTPSRHLETQSRHPRQRHFYVIQGTCPIYSALYYIKMPLSGWCLGVSGWCLDGVWMVSGGVWMVSGWCLRVSGMYGYQIPFAKCYRRSWNSDIAFSSSALYCVIKTPIAGGVWGVWMVSGMCLRTEEVSGCSNTKSISKNLIRAYPDIALSYSTLYCKNVIVWGCLDGVWGCLDDV